MEKWMNYDIWYMKVSVVGHARIIGLLTLLDAKIMMMSKQSDRLNSCLFAFFFAVYSIKKNIEFSCLCLF